MIFYLELQFVTITYRATTYAVILAVRIRNLVNINDIVTRTDCQHSPIRGKSHNLRGINNYFYMRDLKIHSFLAIPPEWALLHHYDVTILHESLQKLQTNVPEGFQLLVLDHLAKMWQTEFVPIEKNEITDRY